MKQLQDEVKEMKKLMVTLKQGGAIGEMFKANSSVEQDPYEQSGVYSVKAQRLEDLKNQRYNVDVSGRHSRNSSKNRTAEPKVEMSQELKISQMKSIQKSI